MQAQGGREPRAPKESQCILVEPLVGVAHGAQHPRVEVLDAAQRIDQGGHLGLVSGRTGRQAPADGVDGEVAATQVLCQVIGPGDRVGPPMVAICVVAPECGHLDPSHVDRAKDAHGMTAGKQLQDGVRPGVRGQVDVVAVADPAAHRGSRHRPRRRRGRGPRVAPGCAAHPAGWPCGRVPAARTRSVATRASAGGQEQVIPPRLVAGIDEVRREQGVDVAAWLARRAQQAHPCLVHGLAALAMVAGLARRHEVVPRMGAATVPGVDVVQGQLHALASAVLAHVAVTREDLASRQAHPGPGPPDVVLKPDDAGCAVGDADRGHLVMVVLDHLGLLPEDEAERPPDVTDVEGLVIRIEQQYDAIHDSLGPDGTRPCTDRIVSHVPFRIARAIAHRTCHCASHPLGCAWEREPPEGGDLRGVAP